MTIINGYVVEPGANLRGANLEGQDLRGEDLTRANLNGANLNGANLEGLTLDRVHMVGASARNAKMKGVEFRSAALSDTDFRGSDLRLSTVDNNTLVRSVDQRQAVTIGSDLNYYNQDFEIEVISSGDRLQARLAEEPTPELVNIAIDIATNEGRYNISEGNLSSFRDLDREFFKNLDKAKALAPTRSVSKYFAGQDDTLNSPLRLSDEVHETINSFVGGEASLTNPVINRISKESNGQRRDFVQRLHEETEARNRDAGRAPE